LRAAAYRPLSTPRQGIFQSVSSSGFSGRYLAEMATAVECLALGGIAPP